MGATAPQVHELEKRLPVIAAMLAARVPTADVRTVLREAMHAAATLTRLANEAGNGPPPHREAIGHLGMVAASYLEPELGETADDGTTPELPRFAELSRILHRMTVLAMQHAPKEQRRGRVDAGRAVALILEALRVPNDDESRRFAERVRPVYGATSAARARNPYPELSRIVWEAATGRAHDARALVDAWRKRAGLRRSA